MIPIYPLFHSVLCVMKKESCCIVPSSYNTPPLMLLLTIVEYTMIKAS